MNFKTTVSTDFKAIEAFLKIPEIWDCISEDGVDKFNYQLPRKDAFFITTWYNSAIAGIMICYKHKDFFKVHIQIKPEFRKGFSKRIASQSLELLGKITNNPLICEIPLIFPNVIKFSESFGFKEKEVIKKNWTKLGVKWDSIVLIKQ